MIEDEFRTECALDHKSEETIDNYFFWIKRFILFTKKVKKEDLNITDVENFLKDIAVDKKLSGSSQSLAFNAIRYLFKRVLKKKFRIAKDWRVKRPQVRPDILSVSEVERVINQFEGIFQLFTEVLYGFGLRKSKASSLRVMDVDFENNKLYVRQAKGEKDRILPMPETLKPKLKSHILKVKNLYEKDLIKKFNGCTIPKSIAHKSPGAGLEFKWQYIFPAKAFIKGKNIRHHFHPSGYDKQLKKVIQELQINKRISAHSFRHSFCTHLIDAGYPIHYIQQLMGHKSSKTTEGYIHITEEVVKPYISPIDAMNQKTESLKIYKIAQ